MNFTPTQDQLDLRDGTRDFLRGSCTPERLRELRDADDKNPRMWSSIAELGLLGYLASEHNGGLGMSAVGFALLAEEAGYVALPEPFSEVAGVSVPVLNALGLADLCSQITVGDARVLALHPLNPYLNQVNEGDLILELGGSEIRLHELSTCTQKPLESIDPLRAITQVTLGEHGQHLASGEQADSLTLLAEQHGAMCSAAQLLGLASAMIDMAASYAQDRQQFGKPIGHFQAVKHHLASALVAVEFARPTVYRAAADIAACASSTSLSCSHAKIAATDAAMQAAEVAIQVHGGMGYTFEVDLHLWMKRVWALAGQWGDRHYHMKRIETALLNGHATGPGETFNL